MGGTISWEETICGHQKCFSVLACLILHYDYDLSLIKLIKHIQQLRRQLQMQCRSRSRGMFDRYNGLIRLPPFHALAFPADLRLVFCAL